MRHLAAIAALAALVFVAWCAGLALAGEPKLDAELASARYVVQPPATAAAVPASGNAVGNASTRLTHPRSTGPAVAVRKSRLERSTPALIWIGATFAVLTAIKLHRRERVYHCRAKGCGRTFIDPLERSHHFRRAHLS